MHKIKNGEYSVHSYPYPPESRCDGSFKDFVSAKKEYDSMAEIVRYGYKPRRIRKIIRFWYDKDGDNFPCPECGHKEDDPQTGGDEIICPKCGGKEPSYYRNWHNLNGMRYCSCRACREYINVICHTCGRYKKNR